MKALPKTTEERIEFLNAEYDRWRHGEMASSGLSPNGERYALRMRLRCAEIDREIAQLRSGT
jgi:hypothetical protein